MTRARNSISGEVTAPLKKAVPGPGLSSLVLRAGGAMVGRGFTSALREMDEAQWLPQPTLEKRSESRLRELLRHAAENVPFYREIYARLGLASSELRTISDLQRLPVVDKSTYREQAAGSFLAANIPGHRRFEWTTSGSTGEPFKFFLDREMMPLVFASHLFYDSWFGLKPFGREVRIMAPSATEPLPPENTPMSARVRYEIHSRLKARYEARTQRRFSTFEVDGERAEEIYRCIETFRPSLIIGYTSSLATIADELLRRDLLLSRRLRGVVTIAETLTPDRQLSIERYFGGPIINRYGQREFKFWCAQSCRESPHKFHVNTELVIWEIVREDGSLAAPGELGRVVLTNLHNYAMPFIRYNTGDLAVAGTAQCACGRGFPLVEQLEGRSIECIRTRGGKTINPVSLGQYLFVSHDWVDAVRHFQLVVENEDRMRLLVVPLGSMMADQRERLRRDMGQLLGEEVMVSVEIVGEIPLEKSGKRPIIRYASR